MPTIAELADAAFVAHEKVKMMSMMNAPADYEERRKSFIEYSNAKADAFAKQDELDKAIGGRSDVLPRSSEPD